MNRQRFSDVAVMSKPRKTADGYLIADAFVARTGIQIYRGSEVGKPDMEMVRVYRSEDQVKDPASVRTYSHAPITLGHPAMMVDADNVASLAKGEVSTEAEWRDGKLKLPLIVKDAAAIAAIESGAMAGLSAGYTCTLDWTAGTAPDGAQLTTSRSALSGGLETNSALATARTRVGALPPSTTERTQTWQTPSRRGLS